MTPDALIFDMDGTLWDAVDLYANSWNVVFGDEGINRTVSRDDLQKVMGLDVKTLLEKIIPEIPEDSREKFYENVLHQYRAQLYKGGVKLYPGVVEGLEKLSGKYKLFILSNCEKDGIKLFLDYSKTDSYITSYIEHGENYLPKNVNMRLLVDNYQLKHPMYIGDTDSDRKESEKAGVPFVWVTYGFGKTDKYAAAFEDFFDLVEYFMAL
ncbi:MAG: HAD family hydrolase [Candidatus Azobacteroides sp.]|nr:HAD family hydrolase [Candidatus Azobacteroides sp.]